MENQMSSGPTIPEGLLLDWVRLMCQRRFYGKTVLSWEDGRIYRIEEERSMKLEELKRELTKKQ